MIDWKSGRYVGEQTDRGLFGVETKALGDSLVRAAVGMAPVPGAIALLIPPEGDQPDLIGGLDGAYHIHPDESRSIIHQMGTVDEVLFDLRGHAVGDNEFAERNEP